MIARLRGGLVEEIVDKVGKSFAHWVIVECAGVGYRVRVSAQTRARLPHVGQEIVLGVHTHAQENQITLYGFAHAQEHELFDLLIKVKDVGPTKAMEILSGTTSVHELAQLIAQGQAVALTSIRGIGKKTAERLVVELRDPCLALLATWRAQGVDVAVPVPKSARDPRLDDVASALINMSFRAALVHDVVARLEVDEGATIEGLLREALKELRDGPR